MADETKTEAPHVVRAILAVMKALGEQGIEKGRRNKEQGFNFRGVEDVINALTPLLVEHNLIIIPRFKTQTSTERESRKGGYLNDVVVSGEFDFISGVDGSMVTGATFGQGMDSADKATNKAMSGAFKYLSIFGFCIPTKGVIDDTDDDHPEAKSTKDVKKEEERDAKPRDRRSPESPPPKGAHAQDDEPPPPDEAPEASGGKSTKKKEEHTPIPDDEAEEPLNWRVENVWPILLADVTDAQTELHLKLCFQRAYKWAKEIEDQQISKNLLAGITDRYTAKKKEMGIG